jgi:hypothetical protein
MTFDYTFNFLAALVGVFIYFLPAVIAYARGHHNWVPIFLLNFFTAWFLLGWIIALIWSTTAVKPKPEPAKNPFPQPTDSLSLKKQLEELRGFYDSGLINEQEYKQKKADILQTMK